MGLRNGLALSSTALGGVRNWWVPLFANGETGLIYSNFSNLALLFQDSTGTTRVTASNDPVGKAIDQKGNISSQGTTTARPTWQANSGKPYLSADGVDDCEVSAVNPSAAMTIAMAFRSATAGGIVPGGGSSGASQRAYLGLASGGGLGG